MKRVRILLLFILFFLVGGGTAYAQSVEDKAPADQPKIQQEAVSTPRENKIETSQARDTATKKESAEPVQEKSGQEGLDSEKGIPVAEKSEKDGLKEDAAEVPAEKDSLKEETTEPAEAKEDGPKEEAGQAPAEEEAIQKKDGENSTSEEVKDPSENTDKEDKISKSDAQEAEELQAKEEAREVLEKGTVLNPQALKSSESADGTEINYTEVTVSSFEELKQKLKDAKDTPTKIIIAKSFEITETLTIEKGQNIILTSNDGKKMDDPWKSIEQPKDYAKEGEKKQREVIKDARERGNNAITAAQDNIEKSGTGSKEYIYTFEEAKDIVIKRAQGFKNTLFEVLGKLTLGEKENSINFDGNKKNVTSNQGGKGSFFNVQKGGHLILNNGVIANGKCDRDDSASIKLHAGSTFTMNGGRITANTNRLDSGLPYTAGAVYIVPGAKFTMNNGMIDHNIGAAGAVFMGREGSSSNPLLQSDKDFALFEMQGGNIVSNEAAGGFGFAGGIFIFPQGKLNVYDGVIADNKGKNRGGGITVTDQYVTDFVNGGTSTNAKQSTTHSEPYEKYILKNKAEANFNGGLIYKNETKDDGGGIFVDTNHANFIRTMILDNKADTLGGGVYISFPPRTQILKDLLITENRAEKYAGVNPGENGAPGVGGGIWSCPYGYIHIGDGHTVYVFNNTAVNKGADYTFTQKKWPFELNGHRIEDQFYVYLSPITKGHNFIQFLNDEGTGKLIPDNISYFKEKAFLKTVYNEILKAEAWKNSGAFILGNSASYGGGLGTNANLETPEDEGEIEFHFKKKWDEKIDKSDYANKDIHVDIFIVPLDKDEVYVRSQYGQDSDLYKYGEVVLNQGNNWQASFTKNDFSNYIHTKDNGLPFTKEQLKKMGYKYLVMERETGYATSIEETNAKVPVQPGTILITRDKSKEYGGYERGNRNADFYFYELNKDGTLSYIGKSTKHGSAGINSEFSHEILSGDIKKIVTYGKDRTLIEQGKDRRAFKGYDNNADKYSIFVEKTKDGIILYVPYIWTEKGDEKDGGFSGIKVVKKDVPPVEKKDFYGYEFTISNRPFTEAKIKKTWKMLTEEEIRQALGEYGTSVEVKNRDIPDQVTFYILKDGKRIVVDYKRDENGKVYPIYKTVTLTKTGGWQGVIRKLDPLYLEKNCYGIEEEALEGFKMSYKLKKVLVDPRENKDNKKDNVKIQFRLSREYYFFSSFGPSDLMKMSGYIPQGENEPKHGDGFKYWLGDVTVRLIVDGHIKEQKKMTLKPERDRYGRINYVFDDENLLFGYDEENPIIVDAGGHNIKVKYYNSMNKDWGFHDAANPSVNLYLKKDEKGIYTMYVPNILIEGNFAKVFKVTEKDVEGTGWKVKYPEITDFNPNADNLEPYYEYIFEVTNKELPPEKPKEPPHNPPHEPPEEPEEPPVIPPEEPPVIPPEVPEEPPVIPEKPPVTPKKPGGAPQTGVESVGSYILLAMTSTLGLGYMRRKKY